MKSPQALLEEGSMKKLIPIPIIAVLVLGFVFVKVWATKGDQQKAADAAEADSQSKTADKQDKKDADCGCDKARPRLCWQS